MRVKAGNSECFLCRRKIAAHAAGKTIQSIRVPVEGSGDPLLLRSSALLYLAVREGLPPFAVSSSLPRHGRGKTGWPAQELQSRPVSPHLVLPYPGAVDIDRTSSTTPVSGLPTAACRLRSVSAKTAHQDTMSRMAAAMTLVTRKRPAATSAALG